jgi:hypothetical protein
MAWVRGTPAFSKFRTAVRRKSSKTRQQVTFAIEFLVAHDHAAREGLDQRTTANTYRHLHCS